jgi:AP2-associated kinase
MIDLYSRLPITLKVDIWAMGCLLYKLMYNTLPFGDSILAIQNGTFVIPDDMSHVYSRDLNLFVKYLLEIDINKRPDIWQVSYITYKLLGMDCPIPNRCQSKIPDLKNVSMPLTDSEFRHQRTAALSKVKSTSTNVIDDSLSHGTAVNPRERPRGMIAPSTSLINFNQRSPAQAVPPPPAPPSSSSLNSSRSGSAAQLMFEDDFSKIPSHGTSLTNIPTKTTTATAKTEQIPFRARPSPPATISAASSHALRQQLIPPPPSSNVHSHRRSSSQTISSTNNQSSFHNASSVNSTKQNGILFHDEQDQVNLYFI